MRPESRTALPDIAVVMVTYNSRDDIVQALPRLESSLAGLHSRIIIVDNASRDGTVAWLQRWHAQSDDHILLLNDSNRGYTAAVNQGLLETAHSRLVLFLNPDVIIPEGAMPALIRCLQQHDRIGVVAPQLRFPDGTIQPSCRRFPHPLDVFIEPLPVKHLPHWLRYKDWKMSDFDHKSSRRVDQPQGAFLLAKRQVLDTVGGLDERFFMFFSDVDWCFQVCRAGWQIYFCSEAFVYHKKGSSVNRSRLAMLVTSHRSFADYFRKHAVGIWAKFGMQVVTFWLLLLLGPRILFQQLGRDDFV